MKYYLYVLLDLTKPCKTEEFEGVCFLYKPYYIGKGSGNRYVYHKYFKNTKHKKNATTKKLFNLGFKMEELSCIFYEGSEKDCYNKEFELINKYKETYLLTNIALGGKGGAGGNNKGKSYEEIFGEEKAKIIKEKQSEKRKGIEFTEEHKNKLSEKLKNNWKNDDYRRNQSEALRGRKMPDDFGEKQSKRMKGIRNTKKHNENISKALNNKTKEEWKYIVQKRNEGRMTKYLYNINGKEYEIHTNTDVLINLFGSKKVYFTMNRHLKTNDFYYNKKLKMKVTRIEIEKEA